MNIVIISPCIHLQPDVAIHSKQLGEAIGEKGRHSVRILEVACDVCATFSEPDLYFQKNSFSAYRKIAEYINLHADICLLQHASSVYGGYKGRFIVDLVYKLNKPLITICHSVVNNPSKNERRILGAIANKSENVVALSQLGLDFLEHFYKISNDKLVRIERGIPILQDSKSLSLLQNLQLEDKKILISGGTLHPRKGYETVINSLPTLINHHPSIVYLIVGVTDRGELKDRGEEYRQSLMMLAQRRGVSNHVVFYNHNIFGEDMMRLISDCHVYLAPGLEEKTIDSSSLVMAIGAGAMVMSTPSWFAKEVLDDQRGIIFPFKSSSDLSQQLLNVLRSEREMKMYKDNAALYGAQFVWSLISLKYLKLIDKCAGFDTASQCAKSMVNPLFLPSLRFDHLYSISDDFGALRCSVNEIIDYKGGYRIVDNALALQVMALSNRSDKSSGKLNKIRTYLSCISYFESDHGEWDCLLGFDKSRKELASEFDIGLTIWSLGVLYRYTESNYLKDSVFNVLHKLLGQSTDFTDIKAKASCIIGLSYVIDGDGAEPELFELVKQYANSILKALQTDNLKWPWFENEISDAFAIVPAAMAHAYKIVGDERYLSAARRSCRFIERLLFSEGVFNPAILGMSVGNVRPRKGIDQDAMEAYYLVVCYSELYKITKEPLYLKQLAKTHHWYLGENNLFKSLYDHSSGACYRALGSRGVIAAKDTASTCAYWLSHYCYLDVHFEEVMDLMLQP